MRFLIALLCLLQTPPALADVAVWFRDGNPHDRFWIENRGCKTIVGVVDIDLRKTTGRVIIDTAYGGIGTKNPMPVEIVAGNIALDPVPDGTQDLTVDLKSIGPKETAIVTLNLDDTKSRWFTLRVEVDGWEVGSDIVTCQTPLGSAFATFSEIGHAVIPNPSAMDCSAPKTVTPVIEEELIS